MATTSPVQRTTALWRARKEGGSDITWQPVERHIGYGAMARKYDLFGFADYIYLEDGETVLVQIGGPGTRLEHKRKILAEPRALQWLRCGNRIELHTWSQKLRKRGGKAKVWALNYESIIEEMFDLQMIEQVDAACAASAAREAVLAAEDAENESLG